MELDELLNYVPYSDSSSKYPHGKTALEIWRDYCKATEGMKFWDILRGESWTSHTNNHPDVRQVITGLAILHSQGLVVNYISKDNGETHYRYERIQNGIVNGRVIPQSVLEDEVLGKI